MRKKGNGKRTADWRRRDPFYERERDRYERPIPSREYILQTLEAADGPLNLEELVERMGARRVDPDALSFRIRAMERDGQLVRNRRGGYVPVSRLDLHRGTVVAHPDGFGFLVPDDGSDDLYLAPRQMRQVFHGDQVVARVTGVDRRGRREGAIVEVLKRNTERLVGRFHSEHGVQFVTPDHKRITLDVAIPAGNENGARHGQIVTVEILRQPSLHQPPLGRILEVLGDHMAPGMEIDIAIRSHGLPLAWPEAVQAEIAGLSESVPPAAKRGREDLRMLPLVTIDGADSRDFDDAVYCEPKPKGWRLLVAIADVAHYVRPGTALDEEARARGNSVYFPERVIPMLPEILSNGLCSLNPDVDRLCLACDMYIDRGGRILRSRFLAGVMRSHARLTYDEVAGILVRRDKALRRRHRALVPHLENLHAVYRVLRRAREKRGAIDFDTTETRIVFGPDRKIEEIVPVDRNDAHKLIEEAMIAANVAAARFLGRHRVPTLYRVHAGPSADRIEDLRAFLAELGLSLGGGAQPTPLHFTRLLREIQGRPDAHLIQLVMLRSLEQARYSPDNIGHFGLALEQYLHFTSPIRRYPDLLVHRAIHHLLWRERNPGPKGRGRGSRRWPRVYPYRPVDMQELGEHCSFTERRADEATRDAVDWLKCEFMADKVGDVYPGVISAVTAFGIFVELEGIYVEGLVHVTALHNDYYHFDSTHHRLTGERTGTSYRLGDPVRVRVVRVDLEERKIDFELADAPAAAKREGRGPRRKRRRRR